MFPHALFSFAGLVTYFYFHAQDLVLRSLLIVSLLAGGAANAYFAADNDDT